ncbi:MAG: nucleotidyltransferase family protein [Candidatus Melainabacteria bacterium]|nr:nucleotidyltransferase family protein [Candidatus Melainabacteria bacterium]
MDVAQVLKEKRESILELAAQYGASNVRVFGSVARGDYSEASDLDFLVDLEPNRSLFDLGGLLMDLQDLLGCKVDIGTTKMLKASIREQVLKEAVLL